MNIRKAVRISASVLALSVFSMSCTKSYTCSCVIKYSGYPGLPDSVINTYSITDTKSNAKSKCSKNSGTFTNNNIKTVETCTLY